MNIKTNEEVAIKLVGSPLFSVT